MSEMSQHHGTMIHIIKKIEIFFFHLTAANKKKTETRLHHGDKAIKIFISPDVHLRS